MTFSDIIRQVGELAIRSKSLESDIKGFVNRSQRMIAARRDWSFMHDVRDFTILANTTSITLGETFKKLGTETSPVSYTWNPGGTVIPVNVASRAQIERLGADIGVRYGTFNTGSVPPRYVFIERNAGGAFTLNIPQRYQATQNLTFHVSAYFFPADLVLGSDETAFTQGDDITDALLHRTRALAYFSVDPTDPKGTAAMALYDLAYKTAVRGDIDRVQGGRSIHM